MGRVINTNNPGKRRNSFMRTAAEILRRLSQQKEIDDETKDMVAMLIFCLRGIDTTVEESIRAWEKRGYWKKADDFQQKWWWSSLMQTSLDKLVKDGDWDKMPEMMIKLFPHFADVKINKMTRNPKEWEGTYQKLMEETNS
jgi:hypothetical protein